MPTGLVPNALLELLRSEVHVTPRPFCRSHDDVLWCQATLSAPSAQKEPIAGNTYRLVSNFTHAWCRGGAAVTAASGWYELSWDSYQECINEDGECSECHRIWVVMLCAGSLCCA